VECLPTDIPDHLDADVSQAEIGDSLRVRDLILPPGVKMLTPAEEVVVVIAPPARVEEVTAPTPEEGALVEEAVEPEVIGEHETSEEAT
jgi:large subunit ribosomal protein L25